MMLSEVFPVINRWAFHTDSFSLSGPRPVGAKKISARPQLLRLGAKLLLPVLVLLLGGCKESVSSDNLSKLGGYWEIEQVIFSNGESKTYTASTVIDFIHIEALQGFRKKVQPKLDGTYGTSNDAEMFTVQERDGRFFLAYRNDLSNWEEELVALDNDAFSLLNEKGIRYDYKRFEPISITP